MRPSRRSTLALLVGAALAVSTWPAHAAGKVKAVASFSILGDLVRQVGGDRVEVTTLVGPNGDAHVFSPSPADAMRVKAARVLFVNGLGLEGWIDRFFKASGSTAPMIVASTSVKPIEGHEDDHDTHKGHSDHRLDPHAWQNVANVKLYVANIRDALIQADPGGKETYEGNAAQYLSKLDALDAEVKAAIAKVPADRRRIITTHDALGYFAAAYGIQVIAPQGVSTEAEASAGDVARIIRQIKAQKIPAVFIENISDDRLMQRIAKETGARIGDKIYSDALSEPNGPAGTYIDMIRNNVRVFGAALMN
ncbi:metal ABC transporter substrate-binding protein [Microvirga tunisiensis]|uniref:Metal ABC transporter substrate-binding protein n=1 Tax=Microvirga tunisiensis TaxID=2108360 RepID=A0A5N7MQY0_9HYPH|nr:metal ABC transporter substrate-binding protein [Microvirga tunisiensis]MPR11167.1 metal ABC transporter substrate-binding protein [Microvirga tunisiensis]MPR29258.1 metal ABC transporter substrate-binding protein [Microvirga tunisiensis]